MMTYNLFTRTLNPTQSINRPCLVILLSLLVISLTATSGAGVTLLLWHEQG